MSNDNSDSWHYNLRLPESMYEHKITIQAFTLERATKDQKNALRDLARQSGFKDLHGFSKWIENTGLSYYDLIKIASPE